MTDEAKQREVQETYLAERLIKALGRSATALEEEAGRPRGIHAKLAAAMGEIEGVAKRGWNENQRYAFVQAGDLANAAREILAKYGIDVEPCPKGEPQIIREFTTKSGTTFHVYRVLIDWYFTDGATGERAGPYTFSGEGMDSGDKGIYKAYTGSLKYLLKLKFLIPDTGDDPEVANEHDRDVADEPRGVAGARERLRRDRDRQENGGRGEAQRETREPDPNALESAEYKGKIKQQLLALGMSEIAATKWVADLIGADRLTRAWTPAERGQIDAAIAHLVAQNEGARS